MDYKSLLKRVIPHLGILIGFIIISFIYFSPIIEGKVLPQMDLTHAQGMSQELVEFEKNNPGESSLWTNSMFGGMPSYQIKGAKSNNIFSYIFRFIRFSLPYSTVAIMFSYLLGFYILLLCFKVNKWISAIGSVAFAFASYNIIIIAVGHITKAYAIAYMAPIIGGVFLVYRKKYILGGIITLLFSGLQIYTTHIQINYYTAILIGIILFVELFSAIKEKEIKHFLISTIIILFCGILAVVPETEKLWTTYEYTNYSIRGEQVLESKQTEDKTGLEKDYAFAWSYGKMETFTLLIPDFYGGASEPLSKDSETYRTLTKNGVQSQVAESIAKSTSAYWGSQPFTSGPVYFGSIIIFLFVLGLFIIKSNYKWWLLISTILSIILSWGGNFEMMTHFFFDYVPLFNKFRTVSMILVIANVTIVLTAFLALKEIYQNQIDKVKLKKSILYSLEITGGVLLFFILFGGSLFNFESASDLSLINQLKANSWPENIINAYQEGVQQDRLQMLRSDALRSLVFILLSVGALFLFIYKKIKAEYFIAILGVLILIDLWGVDKRYLNNDAFITSREEKNQFKLTSADEQILRDKGLNNRVLNLTKSPFNDAYTPYYHQSIGGYHGAKLRRYQDVVDYHLNPSLQNLVKVLNLGGGINQVDGFLASQNILNMLNTKYIILSENFVLTNNSAFGNAWFVNNPLFVSTNDDEIKKIGEVNLKESAVIHEEFKDLVGNNYNNADSGANNITLKSYKPNHLIYDVNALNKGIAVFSEIYYPKGWIALIDGKETDFFRANYILRAMIIPEGNHTIEFVFNPRSYIIGKKISFASSAIVVILILSGLIVLGKKKKEELN